jgi:hypothetical protein
MKPKRFVHVGFNCGDTPPPIDELEKTFAHAKDWLRYSHVSWILYTSLELDDWRDRIRNTNGIKTTDSFFLVEFQRDGYSGYMHESAWKWLNKDRS